MKLIRAIEQSNWHVIHRCLQAYPQLKDEAPDLCNGSLSEGQMKKLRDHAVLLYRAQLLGEMRDIQDAQGHDDEDTQKMRKSRVQASFAS